MCYFRLYDGTRFTLLFFKIKVIDIIFLYCHGNPSRSRDDCYLFYVISPRFSNDYLWKCI